MAVGKVKWFSDSKGYGFIQLDGSPKDIFVHYSDISGEGFKSLDEGVSVEFEVESGSQGDRARNVLKVVEA
jgi:CspA family cold shock protein